MCCFGLGVIIVWFFDGFVEVYLDFGFYVLCKFKLCKDWLFWEFVCCVGDLNIGGLICKMVVIVYC